MDDAIWMKHLEPGERLVWQAGASPALLRAVATRRRWMAALLLIASLGLSAAFGWKLYESIVPQGGHPTLATGVALPLYGALLLTFLAVAVGQVQRISRPPPPMRQYAITDHRLLTIDASGALVEQVDRQEIAGVILGGRPDRPDLYVLRQHDDTNVNAFSIEHIDKPLEAKAIIEEQLLDTTPTETTP